MKAIDLLVNEELPGDLRDYNRRFDARGVSELMAEIAERHPDKYERISKRLGDIGRHTAYRQGETLGLSDLRLETFDRDAVLAEMDAEIAQLDRDDPDFGQKRLKIWLDYTDRIQKEVMAAALAEGSNLGYSVVSGARGKPAQLRAMLATPGLYSDHFGNVVPIYVRRSFGEGLRPAEWLAGTFGARKAVISTKRNTAEGGDWGKQMNQAAASLVVTEKDCGTRSGILLDPEDPSLRGRVLLRPAAGLEEGEVVDKKGAAAIRRAGGRVLVRSPQTCGAEGLCARCVGKFHDRKFPSVGDEVGIVAASAVAEPIVQAGLNTKHQGGMASGARSYSGFDYVSQFTQVPREFKDRAVLAEKGGMVDDVSEAPQGGSYVTVDGERHYVPAGHKVLVSPGQEVERGVELSEGLASPADVVRLRGLGEGRRYFATRLNRMLDDSGMYVDPRNTEILARAVLDRVVVEDPEGLGDWLPDDSVRYSSLSRSYTPPPDARMVKPREAVGMYLQAPGLHYTIGTRLEKSMADALEEAGYDTVAASPSAPGFVPEMSRLRTTTQGLDDWIAGLSTSYLKQRLQDASYRGADSNVRENTHFAPRLAVGEGFGENAGVAGRF